jgi:lipopolysaccharide export system ATP-binding protein
LKDSSALILDSIFFRVPENSILEGAYLKAEAGQVTAIVGRNGSGKSTLLKVAAGQYKATAGITIIDGERIHNKSLNRRYRKIGYLPQDTMLPPDITVKRLIKSLPESGKLTEDPLIQKIVHQKTIQLSGGEKRYLETAVLFHLNRKYILLDEPFTGVEPTIIDLLIDRIRKEAQNGKGILLTDHMHRYISLVADKGYLIHNQQCYDLGGDFSQELKLMGYHR